MKCTQQGTDLEVDFSVYCDERKCEEFVLPADAANSDEGTVKECFVPIEEGTHVVVAGSLDGTLLHARFDLLADGSFLGDRLVTATADGQAKVHRKRRIEFRNVDALPARADAAAAAQEAMQQEKPEMVDGEMCAKPIPKNIDSRFYSADGNAFGVGTMAVIISLEHEPQDGYLPAKGVYPDMTLGAWKQRQVAGKDTGITPTHELDLQNINDKVIPQKARRTVKHFGEKRYGRRPWAILMFHYRSRAAIEEASCVPLVARAFPLKGYEEDDEHGLFMTPPPVIPFKGAAAGPAKDVQKKRLGGKLVLPEGMSLTCFQPDERFADRFGAGQPGEHREERLKESTNRFRAINDDWFQQDSSDEPITGSFPHAAFGERSTATSKRAGVGEGQVKKTAILEAAASSLFLPGDQGRRLHPASRQAGRTDSGYNQHLARASFADFAPEQTHSFIGTATSAHSLAIPQGNTLPPPPSNRLPRLLNMALPKKTKPAQPNKSSAEIADDLPTIDQVREYLQQGRVRLVDFIKHFFPGANRESRKLAVKAILERFRPMIKYSKDETNEQYFELKGAESTSGGISTQPSAPHSASAHEKASEYLVNKRSASPLAREGSSTKRGRLDELAAHKAKLEKEVLAKKARTAAAIKALEDAKKRNEEERAQSEALEAEVEMLEKANAEEDAKYTELMKDSQYAEVMKDIDEAETKGV